MSSICFHETKKFSAWGFGLVNLPNALNNKPSWNMYRNSGNPCRSLFGDLNGRQPSEASALGVADAAAALSDRASPEQ